MTETVTASETDTLFYDKDGASISLEQWVALRRDFAYRLVARDTVGDWEVITVWSGIDQGSGFGEPPLMFGTISCSLETGEYDDEVERFAGSEADALVNHRELVARLGG